MNTSANKIENLRSSDPIDQMIFERGLRIKRIWIDRDSDLIILLLNNKKLLKRPLSDFSRLCDSTTAQLDEFNTDGISIHWTELDEHLSLRGCLRYELEHLSEMSSQEAK